MILIQLSQRTFIRASKGGKHLLKKLFNARNGYFVANSILILLKKNLLDFGNASLKKDVKNNSGMLFMKRTGLLMMWLVMKLLNAML